MKKITRQSKRDDSEEKQKQCLAELYVHSANRSTSKSTWAYILLIIVCITAGMAIYNEYGSFMKRFIRSVELAYDEDFRQSESERLKDNDTNCLWLNNKCKSKIEKIDSLGILCNNLELRFDEKSIHGLLVKNLIEKYVDTIFFSFPVIGIGIATADIISILAICILLVFLWSLACLRNENLVIGKILNRTQDYPLYLKKYILSGIGFENVFYPVSYRNKPFSTLETDDINKRSDYAAQQERRYHHNVFASHRLLSAVLFILPLIVISMGLIVTCIDSCFSKLFRAGIPQEVFVKVNEITGYETGINCVIILMSFVLFILIALYIKAIRYTKATSDMLYEYKNTIRYETDTAIALHLLQSDKFKQRNYRLRIVPVTEASSYKNAFFLYSLHSYPKQGMAHILHTIEKVKDQNSNTLRLFKKRMTELNTDTFSDKSNKWWCVLIEFDD